MKITSSSVSIIIPAFNEEKNITLAVKQARYYASQVLTDYELILVDDGSRDGTWQAMEKIARTHRQIKCVQIKQNSGVGYAFRAGLKHANRAYVAIYPGDNDTSGKSLKLLLEVRRKADIIISYTINPQKRTLMRRFASKIFVISMNLLFGLKLKYFTGCFIAKTALIRSLPLSANGFMFFAEPKIRLLKQGFTYQEIPFIHTGRKFGQSKIFTFRLFFDTFKTTLILFKNIYLS